MKKYFIITVIFSITILALFIHSYETILITKENINIFFNTLLPSLFPYMIFVILFVNFKCHLILAYIIQYISLPLFNISGKSMSIVLISIIGGYPLLAILAKEIVNEDNKDELNILIPLFSFPSFAFFFNIIFNNIRINLFIVFLFISFIILLIFKDKKKKEYININDIKNEYKNKFDFIKVFNNSFKKALLNLGIIFSNLLFFSLFKVVLNIQNETINNFIIGLLEFSKSSIYFSLRKDIISILCLSFLLLFGGLSVNFQILNAYDNSLLKIKKYYKYRMLLIILVLLFIYIYY